MINKLWAIVLSLITRRQRRRQTAKFDPSVIHAPIDLETVLIPVKGTAIAKTSSPFRLTCPSGRSTAPRSFDRAVCYNIHPNFSSGPALFVRNREGYYERIEGR